MGGVAKTKQKGVLTGDSFVNCLISCKKLGRAKTPQPLLRGTCLNNCILSNPYAERVASTGERFLTPRAISIQE